MLAALCLLPFRLRPGWRLLYVVLLPLFRWVVFRPRGVAVYAREWNVPLTLASPLLAAAEELEVYRWLRVLLRFAPPAVCAVLRESMLC